MEQNPENLQARIESGTAQDLKFDPDNANEGTESGDYVLTQSIQNTGVGRGVLTDKNKILLAGNKTAAKVGELGLEDVVFVHTTGNTTVVTVRDDLDLLAPEDSDEFQRAREASIADNWASIKNTQINPSVITRYRERGVKSEKYISESDWERLTSGLRPETPNDNPDTIQPRNNHPITSHPLHRRCHPLLAAIGGDKHRDRIIYGNVRWWCVSVGHMGRYGGGAILANGASAFINNNHIRHCRHGSR